ncbi:MAG: helix-turn-helix domain-containing protein [Chitinophagaceae bacterium]
METNIACSTMSHFIKQLIMEALKEFHNSAQSPYYSQDKESLKKTYSRNEVAQILGTSPNTVTKYIRQKKLHATVLNGVYYINHKELQKFLTPKTEKND